MRKRHHSGLLKVVVVSAILLSWPLSSVAQIPESISEQTRLLTEEEREFLLSDEALRVIPVREQLWRALSQRTAEQVQIYVQDMQAALAAFAFDPDRDLGAIPLNPEATVFNRLVREPPALWKIRREPGPFSVQRYLKPSGGIPTFAGAPVAVTPEDLVVGKVDVVFAGIPQSMSSGWRDGRHAPGALRAMHGLAQADGNVVDPAQVLNLADYGDVSVDRMSLELSQGHVTEVVRAMAATGARPFLVGGDHSMIHASVSALKQVHERSFTVIHFGAHFNAEQRSAHTIADTNAVYRLLEDGLVTGPDLIQVGLHGPHAAEADLNWLRSQSVRYHTMVEVEREGWPAVMSRVLSETRDRQQPIYLSFDMSVLDIAEVSAIARPVPGGLQMREIVPLIRSLCSEEEVLGFELADFAPMLDISYVSAINANAVMNACLTGMAQRRQAQR